MPVEFQLPGSWPRPADPKAAARLRERFANLGRAEAALAQQPGVAGLLAALGGNSPFLSELVVSEAASLRLLANAGPRAVVDRALQEIADTPPSVPRARVASGLRQAKRQVALAVAVADLGDIWPLDDVTAALSDFAEAALRLAVAHLLHEAGQRDELNLSRKRDPASGSGFAVLGMGKLGGRELNYSSDIDLMLLFDPAAHGGADDIGPSFTRIARALVGLMENRNEDGYVFRTDLRLRPDPAATAPVLSLQAAIAYYESMGQNWERAAMLKARPVAGDLDLAATFLEAIRPFVWRRHLDFAMLADIHTVKRRIDTHKGGLLRGADELDQIAGHDVKLGQGGIREIEFLVQTLQLIWGGREPELRVRRTLDALALLTRSGHLPPQSAAALGCSYRFLRRVEHRLQMVMDRQTHRLPESRQQLEQFACFMNYPDAGAMAAALLGHLRAVTEHYAALFESVRDPPDDARQLDFSGPDPSPATVAALAQMGFSNPAGVVAVVHGWLAGRPRALRSQRARELLTEVLPRLLAAVARQTDPDVVLARLDGFFSTLPTGVQPLSLFQHNPGLLDRVAAVLGAAPSLAQHLASVPSALESFLLPDEAEFSRQQLRARLHDARNLEDAITVIGRVVREEDFRISVATMENRLDADASGLARAALADAALSELFPRVIAEQIERHGRVPGGGMVVVALGKLGGREMMAGSDLDLMFVYDHPAEVTESVVAPRSSARKLPASQWFIRAAHAFVAALTATGPTGPLYAVDMRLRPSGNKGPVAVSLTSFRSYHAKAAWTWERMALTRARVIAGPGTLRPRVAAAIREAIASARPASRTRADAAAMRARVARELPAAGPWDVKFRPGGLVDVEFVAQMSQLVYARVRPDVLSPTTRIALRRLAGAGLLDRMDAAVLVHADHLWRTVQGLLRITLGRSLGEKLPSPSAQALLRAASAGDIDELRAAMDDVAQRVHAIFTRLIGWHREAPIEEIRQ
jgi:glutamate-ammonia-ligase adenylyltransferase